MWTDLFGSLCVCVCSGYLQQKRTVCGYSTSEMCWGAAKVAVQRWSCSGPSVRGLWSAQIRSEDLSVCLFLFGRGSGGILPTPPRHSAIPSPGFTLGAQSTGAPLTSPSPRPTPWWPRRPEFDQRKNTGRLPTEPNQNQGPCRGAGSAPPRLTSPTMTLIRDISLVFPCV